MFEVRQIISVLSKMRLERKNFGNNWVRAWSGQLRQNLQQIISKNEIHQKHEDIY